MAKDPIRAFFTEDGLGSYMQLQHGDLGSYKAELATHISLAPARSWICRTLKPMRLSLSFASSALLFSFQNYLCFPTDVTSSAKDHCRLCKLVTAAVVVVVWC